MVEVHTTEVTRDEGYSCKLTSILEQRGFNVKEGGMMEGVTCDPQEDGMIKVVQRVEEEHRETFQVRGKSQVEESMLVLKEAEKKFILEVAQDRVRKAQGGYWEKEVLTKLS